MAAVGQPITLITSDAVSIDAYHDPWRGSAAAAPSEQRAIVLAHGFTGSWRRPAVRRIAEVLSATLPVVSLDFRGHGRSGGVSTVGDKEVLDLEAAVDWARRLGYRSVATLGFSMGAAVALRHAALHRSVAAVAAVSGPGRWYYRSTPSARRAHWVIERRLGRLVGRVALGTRIAPSGWDPVPMPPQEAAAALAPIPLLVVHGDADPYFPVDHARSLYAAAGEPKQLWIEAGFGHAENAATPDLVQRIGDWLARASTDRHR